MCSLPALASQRGLIWHICRRFINGTLICAAIIKYGASFNVVYGQSFGWRTIEDIFIARWWSHHTRGIAHHAICPACKRRPAFDEAEASTRRARASAHAYHGAGHRLHFSARAADKKRNGFDLPATDKRWWAIRSDEATIAIAREDMILSIVAA